MPLRLAPLVTLIVLGLTLAIALKVGAFGLPLVIILLTWLFKYSFAFLDRLVAGDTEPPVLSLEMVLGAVGEWRSLLPFIVVVVVFFASGAAAYWVGFAAAVIAALFAIVWLPAILALQGWTGGVGQSLNPVVGVRMARALGRDYVWMVACTFAVVVLCVGVPRWVGGLPLALRIALLIYAWLATIAVTGSALRANRQHLLQNTEFFLTLPAVVTPEALEREREHWLDSVYGAWRSNARENAWRTVRGRVDDAAEPLTELRWLYGRVAGWEPPQFANRIVQEMLPRLRAAGREDEALILVRERLAIDPGFRGEAPSRLAST